MKNILSDQGMFLKGTYELFPSMGINGFQILNTHELNQSDQTSLLTCLEVPFENREESGVSLI